MPVILLFIVILLVFIPQIFITHNIIQSSIMTDLHSRIIGSRLMNVGRSPYFFQWQYSDGVRFYNPNASLPYKLNGVTATPFYLWIQRPLSIFNYCDIKYYWWIIEEMLLFATVFFAARFPSTLFRQVIVLLIATIFFIYSRNWWLHVYAGQYYVLFACAFSVSAWLISRKPKSPIIIFAIMGLIRPFFFLSIIPWVFKNWMKKAEALFIGGITCLVLILLSGSYRLISDYTNAMSLYATQVFGWPETVLSNTVTATETCVQRVTEFNHFDAGGLFSLQHYLNLVGVRISDSVIYFLILSIFLACLIFISGFKKIGNDYYKIFITAFLIYLFAELFTPAVRNPYNIIQYLGIIGIVVERANWKALLLLIIGLALNHDFPFRFSYQREIGEAVMLIAIWGTLLSKSKSRTYQSHLAH